MFVRETQNAWVKLKKGEPVWFDLTYVPFLWQNVKVSFIITYFKKGKLDKSYQMSDVMKGRE